ncbi:MAG: DUF1016 family protein [Treponema sp.]|nr:DUF1016 family protein [Treponema sp.]
MNRQEKSFEEIRSIIVTHRSSALRGVNTESILMNWEVGCYISARLKSNEWGSKVVTELSEYLRVQDPTLKGYSRRNLYNMVAFYEAYSTQVFFEMEQRLIGNKIKNLQTAQIVQTTSAQLPIESSEFVQSKTAQLQPPKVLFLTTFSNHVEIINHCKSDEERLFYILYSFRENLKFKELQRCIQTDTYSSLLGDKKNISKGLKEVYPKAEILFKDTAFVDFLNLPQKHSEAKLHKGLLENMKQFVLELGKDFIFMESEYPLRVGGSTFKVDLLFFHRGLQCLVAVELKTKNFKPEHLGQLEFYLEALDRDVKRSNENPSVGILWCPSSDHSVVEYAMSRSLSPTMVTDISVY